MTTASHPIFDIGFLGADHAVIEQPQEWAPCYVHIIGDVAHWEDLRLVIQKTSITLSLKRFDGQTHLLAPWERSGPGHYDIRLLHDGDEVCARRVEVRSSKFSQSSYESLMQELEETLPAAIVIGLSNTGGFTGARNASPVAGGVGHELSRLRRAVYGVEGVRPGLVDVLFELSDKPHSRLQTEHLWVRADKARRPVASQLYRAAASPANVLDRKRPTKVIDGRVEQTVDVYENRLVKLFWAQVDRRLRYLLNRVGAQRDSGHVKEISEMIRLLRRGRRQAGFLDDVRLPQQPPTNLTMVLLKNEPYRAAMEGWLEFTKSQTVQLDLPQLDAPLENLPLLYETWGVLKVIEALLVVAARHGYQTIKQRLVKRPAGDLFVEVLPDGQPALVMKHPDTARVLSLRPQANYRRSGTLNSISFAQIPDISIEIKSDDGRHDLLIFDPKYKLRSEILADSSAPPDGRPKKEDIDKMHAYRDAIRDENMNHVVRFAATLYPGQENQMFHDDIAAISAVPGEGSKLEETLDQILSRHL
tara:strand:- start:7146 stop:8738 length:1593 start_codon:yes stop_codon:yes gene_type:complete